MTPVSRSNTLRLRASLNLALVLLFGIGYGMRAEAAFSSARYQDLVQSLQRGGGEPTVGTPRRIDGEIVLPKPFRVALASFLGDGFRGNVIVVASDGRVSVRTVEPEARAYVVDFACRQPGFNIQWRAAGGRDDYAVVGVKTEAAACVTADAVAAGAALWRVPKGRDQPVADALGLLRDMYVQGH